MPGTVAGLALAHEKYGSGRFTLAELMAPAIELARVGFAVDTDTANSLPAAKGKLARWPASAKIFLKDGEVLREGERLVQADLAASLQAIARDGPRAFYEGPIAEKIVAAVRAAGGIMTLEDLHRYRAIEREPVRGSYRGYDLVSMSPPSSGGVLLVEILNILEGYRLGELPSDAALHVMIEAMKRAYADRAEFLGDPDAVDMPVARLTSKAYAGARCAPASIPSGRARLVRSVPASRKATTPRISRSSTGSAMRSPIPIRSI